MRASALIEALKFKVQRRAPVGILGAPGVGKTDIVRSVAADMGLPCITMNLMLSDPTDLSGLPFLVTLPDGSRITDWAKMKAFVEATKAPITLFLDELFQAPTAVMNAAAPLILEKRVGDLHLHPDSWVVFASNRAQDKAGTNRVPSHIPNRCTLYELDVSVDDWSNWALNHSMPIELIQFIRMCHHDGDNTLHDFDPNRLVNATPRQWAAVGEDLNAGIPEHLQLETFGGQVGEGHAAKFRAFLQVASQLPSREQILLAPDSAPVPENMSARWAVSGMLASAATQNNFGQCVTYMQRLPEELQALFVKDAMRIKPEVCNTKAFGTWAISFADVLR